MRRLILNIHLAIGLVAGVFVIVLGATGSILAFEPELDRLLHRDISYVKSDGKPLSLVEIGDVIARKYPGQSIVAFLPSPAPDFPAGVILSRGIISVNPLREKFSVCAPGTSHFSGSSERFTRGWRWEVLDGAHWIVPVWRCFCLC